MGAALHTLTLDQDGKPKKSSPHRRFQIWPTVRSLRSIGPKRAHLPVNTLRSALKTCHLVPYGEITAVCSVIHVKHKLSVWTQCGVFQY
jgi:hypothetical protein